MQLGLAPSAYTAVLEGVEWGRHLQSLWTVLVSQQLRMRIYSEFEEAGGLVLYVMSQEGGSRSLHSACTI